MEHHLIIEHGDARLWPLLGPFLCDRAVHKELGSPLYSGKGVTWFFALDDEGRVLGFVSLCVTSTGLWHDHDYVVPGRRGKGVHARLAKLRDKRIEEIASDLPEKVAVPRHRWKHYRQRGWKVASERGSWVYGERS